MNEKNLTLTDEENNILKELKQNFQLVQFELGEIEITKIQLEKHSQILKDKVIDLQQKEEEFRKSLLDKYGDISLNVETGEYEIIK